LSVVHAEVGTWRQNRPNTALAEQQQPVVAKTVFVVVLASG
jgi:hypothetical protein